MEVIIGAEAPEYLKRPYAWKEDTVDTPAKDIVMTKIKNGIGHKVQSTVTKPYRGKDLKKTRDDHKCLEKGSENTKSKAESEKVKTAYMPILPQNCRTV
jgi:hypothetical protein